MVRVQYYIGNKYIGSAELTYRLNRWDYITIKDQKYRVTKCESIMQDNAHGVTDYTNNCQSIELEKIKNITIDDIISQLKQPPLVEMRNIEEKL